MASQRVGDLIQHNGQTHVITALDFLFKKATLRPVDEGKPTGQCHGTAVVVSLSKLPIQ